MSELSNLECVGYKAAVDEAHALLDKAGIPQAAGTLCNDAECKTVLGHRVRQVLAYRATLSWYDDYVDRQKESDPEGICFALGIGEEAGEVQGAIKKLKYHHRPEFRDKIEEELGDTLFYLIAIAHVHGMTLEGVMLRNKKKLDERYPDGWKPGGGIRKVSEK